MSKRIIKAVPAIEVVTDAVPGVGVALGGFAPPAGDEVDLKVDIAVTGDTNEAPHGADAFAGDRPVAAGATAPRAEDQAGRPLDAWGLPLNGPARARALAELGRRDPVAHPEDWSGQSSTEE